MEWYYIFWFIWMCVTALALYEANESSRVVHDIRVGMSVEPIVTVFGIVLIFLFLPPLYLLYKLG